MDREIGYIIFKEDFTMSLIIPEEIKAALDIVRNEAAEEIDRRMAGIKFGFWVLSEGEKTKALLEREKAIAEEAKSADPTEFIPIIMGSVQRVGQRMAEQREIDELFEEVTGIMHRLQGDPNAKRIVVCNGHATDITRAAKSNKNDGDKAVMPA